MVALAISRPWAIKSISRKERRATILDTVDYVAKGTETEALNRKLMPTDLSVRGSNPTRSPSGIMQQNSSLNLL